MPGRSKAVPSLPGPRALARGRMDPVCQLTLAFRYIGQPWKFIQVHRAAPRLTTVIVGDLNSNVCWDKQVGTTVMWSENWRKSA